MFDKVGHPCLQFNLICMNLESKHTLFFFLISSAVCLFFGYDALTTQGVIGYSGAEIWAFVWGHHWMHDSLSQGVWPYQTTLLDYPSGGVLWLKDPLLLVLMHPIRALFGIRVALLFSQYLLFILASMATFHLGRRIGITPFVSMIMGLVYAFCPHALGEAYNGNMEAIAHGFLPLWLCTWVMVLQTPSLKHSMYCGIALFFLLLSNQYWAGAMSICGFVMFIGQLKKTWKEILWPLLSVALGVVLFAPVAYLIWESLHVPLRLNDITAGSVPLQPPYITDIKEVAFPSINTQQTPFQDIVYVGFLLFFLALLAPFKKSSWRYLGTGLGIFFFILMLGPVVFFDGEIIKSADGSPYRLPWFYLIQSNPILEWMTLPHRMAIPATLFLVIAVGSWLNTQRFAFLWGGLLLCEIWLYPGYTIPLQSTSLPQSHHANTLRGLPKGGVLNLPVNLFSNEQRIFLWYQSQHHMPIADHFRYSEYPRIAQKSAFVEYSRALSSAPLPSREQPDPLQIQELKDAGFRYIVVHKAFVREQLNMSFDGYIQWLNLHLGEGVLLQDAAIYPLEPSVLDPLLSVGKSTLFLGSPPLLE